MSSRYVVLFASLTALAVGACTGDKSDKQAALPPPEVHVSKVVVRDVTDYGEYTGRADATETVEVRSRVTGYLREVAFRDGDEVKKGDVLFQIDPRPFEAALKNAEGQKLQWQARQARAQADVARYEKLVPTGAATAQDLDKVRADLGEATAAIQSAEAEMDQAKLDLEFSRITAPISGQISRALITQGNLVRGNVDLLTTIVTLDPVSVYFNVNERDLLQFRDRALAMSPEGKSLPDLRECKIPVLVGLANEAGYPHEGLINFADNRVDASTGTIQVRGQFDNTKRTFKPGLFARVRVPVNSFSNAMLVSDRAVATDQSQKFVYVVDSQNLAQYRAVKLGRLQDDGLRVVTNGLNQGETVIVTGIQRARPGKPVSPKLMDMPRIGFNEKQIAPTGAATSQPAAERSAAPQPGANPDPTRASAPQH